MSYLLNALPDSVWLIVFEYLRPCDLYIASRTCKRWNRIANDEIVWLKLVKLKGRAISKNEGETWKETYKRITHHVPCVLARELKSHEDEVYVAAFSPSGSFLATGASDGVIKVWNFDDLDTTPKSRKVSSNHYADYAEFNQLETLLLVNVVRSVPMIGIPTATIVIVSVTKDDLPLVCALAEPFKDFQSTWYSDTSFLGTMKSWGSDRLGIWKCEIPYCVGTKEDDIDSLCSAWKETTLLFDIKNDFNEYRMVKVLDVDQNHTEGMRLRRKTADRKLIVLYNVDMKQTDRCGIYLYQISSNPSEQRSLVPLKPILLKSECLGLWLSHDKRFLCANTRILESVDLDVVDEVGRLDNVSYSEKITLQVYDISKSEEMRTYHGNTATDRNHCCSLVPSASEHSIASGTEKGTVLIWDRQSTTLLYALTHIEEVIPRASCVNAVAFHPKDPEVLVSVADNKIVRIWKSQNRIKKDGLRESHSNF